MIAPERATAQISFTTESRRRGAVRKSKEVHASPAKLPAAVERAVKKLEDAGAFGIEVRYETYSQLVPSGRS